MMNKNLGLIVWLLSVSVWAFAQTTGSPCNNDYVYPGDANNDHIVNKSDILAIGLVFGYQGPARQNPNQSWSPQNCAPWNGNIPGTNTNSKHADCTGNGIVSMSDFNTVFYNWRETHQLNSPSLEQRPSTGVSLRINFLQDSITLQHNNSHEYPFEAEILIGNSTLAASDLYGIAFTIEYNPSLIGGSPLMVEYEDDWFGQNNSNGTTKLFAVDNRVVGKLDIAITRLNHQSANGSGRIAKITGGVIGENIHGRNLSNSLKFTVSGIEAVGANGNSRDFIGINDSLILSSNYTATTSLNKQIANFQLVPNPVSASQNLNLVGIETDFNYTITNTIGQVVQAEKNVTTRSISTVNMQPGSYLITVTTEKGSSTKPFFIK